MSKPPHIALPEPNTEVAQQVPEEVAVTVSATLPAASPVLKRRPSCFRRCFRIIFFLIAFIAFQFLYTYGLFIAYSKFKPETNYVAPPSQNATSVNTTKQPETIPSVEPTTPTTKPEEPVTQPEVPIDPGYPRVKMEFNFTKVATIMDTRADPGLVPLVLHFMGVLGSDWPVKIFYTPQNHHIYTDSAIIRKYVASGRVNLIELPGGTQFTRRTDVSSFLTQRWIWEQLAPASYVLFFQLDSIICGNSYLAVEDFFQYDMIGAPWRFDWGVHWGANGGLSLRRREKILQVLDNYDWKQSREPEDVFYVKRLTWLPGSSHPTDDISKTFSVEEIWYDKPLGYHQPHQKWASRRGDLNNHCPEYALAKEYYMNN